MAGCGEEVGTRVEHPWQNDRGEYEVLDTLGQGAYGQVFHVKNTRTGEEFAKKTVKVTLSDEGVPQSVVREISTLERLKRHEHPNVVKLVDVTHGLHGETQLYINMIFEKCDWDLYFFLQSITQPLPENQIKQFTWQILNGIHFLHANGVIHRDIKPQNILVNANMQVKLTDFGLARIYSAGSQMTTVVVTLWYRAPEILLQCQYNGRVDLWSVGCIVVEMYNRQPLFPANTEVELIRKILDKVGLPSLHDWPCDAVVARSSFPAYPGIDLKCLAPTACPAAKLLIASLLQFVPDRRPDTNNCLNSPYFDDFMP